MTLHHGDCLDVMAGMEPESVDAIVTDPPYFFEFMGKAWDNPMVGHAQGLVNGKPGAKSRGIEGNFRRGELHVKMREAQQWHQRWAAAAYGVAKPGAYLLAFGGTRTVHRMTVALEDAGWIIRDMLVWAYASGFPKSKASLKPAWEPIVMARKPGSLRELAIDACRIGTDVETWPATRGYSRHDPGSANKETQPTGIAPSGRWPANVILTDPIFDGGWDGVVGGGETASGSREGTYAVTGYSKGWGDTSRTLDGDSGTYSRFFLIPKADRADREPVLPSGIEPRRETAHRRTGAMDTPYLRGETFRVNAHPTVKPTELMRHLVRLVTPIGGVVLDPFAGSGSTLLAAEQEGFAWIGIEKEAEYVAIAEARLNGTQRGMAL